MAWLPAAVSYVLAASPADVPQPVSPADAILTFILGYGVLGVVAAVLGWVLFRGTFVTSGTADKARTEAMQRERERADEWKALYLDEVAGHQKTRDALALANSRAESAAEETAAITRSLVESATRRDRERGRPGKASP